MRFLFINVLLVAVLITLFVTVISDQDSAPSTLAYDDIKKLTVKDLKKMLKERGLECKGCSEKADYVDMVFEHINDEVLKPPSKIEEEAEPKAAPKSNLPPDGKLNQKEMDELMASLKNKGFGNSKMFSADDLKNLNPEELQETLKGKTNFKSGKSKSDSKSSKSSKSSSSSSKKSKSSSKGSKPNKFTKDPKDTKDSKSSSSSKSSPQQSSDADSDTIEL